MGVMDRAVVRWGLLPDILAARCSSDDNIKNNRLDFQFGIQPVVVLYLVLKECGDEFVGEIDAHDEFQKCAYEEADK